MINEVRTCAGVCGFPLSDHVPGITGSSWAPRLSKAHPSSARVLPQPTRLGTGDDGVIFPRPRKGYQNGLRNDE